MKLLTTLLLQKHRHFSLVLYLIAFFEENGFLTTDITNLACGSCSPGLCVLSESNNIATYTVKVMLLWCSGRRIPTIHKYILSREDKLAMNFLYFSPKNALTEASSRSPKLDLLVRRCTHKKMYCALRVDSLVFLSLTVIVKLCSTSFSTDNSAA